MISLEEAQERILAQITPLQAEEIPLAGARHRILARSIRAPLNLPGFDMSAMDGYAVRVEDLEHATPAQPVFLKIGQKIPAGGSASRALEPLTCARVFTGSAIPTGADAVVMQEDVLPGTGDAVGFPEKPQPWENMRFRGEDVRDGDEMVGAGEVVTAGTIALLGALGIQTLAAAKRPRARLLASGNELKEPGESLGPGEIYESNRLSIQWLAEAAGAIATVGPIVPDDPQQTRRALEDAFADSDVVISSGGVSVGEFDFLKESFEAIGGSLQFWRVAIKPGKPFVCGTRDGKWFFGLPGNPVSAFVTFLLLVRPALLRLQGAKDVSLRKSQGELTERMQNPGDRRHFVRVTVQDGKVRSAGPQGSHRLRSLARANALLDVPAGAVLEPGTAVTALQWD